MHLKPRFARAVNNMKIRWQSSILRAPFERVVVGFDFRKEGSLAALFMSSYDESVRYEYIYETHADMLSPMGLFSENLVQVLLQDMPPDARVIAFDLPAGYVSHLLIGNVSNPLVESVETLRQGWRFMGFDTVDPMTQSSAFHAFDVSPKGCIDEIDPNYAIRNRVGLFDDADAALRSAAFFDEMFPEHAPFVPCGIWLKGEKTRSNSNQTSIHLNPKSIQN
jgi:hypothetical protein